MLCDRLVKVDMDEYFNQEFVKFGFFINNQNNFNKKQKYITH